MRGFRSQPLRVRPQCIVRRLTIAGALTALLPWWHAGAQRPAGVNSVASAQGPSSPAAAQAPCAPAPHLYPCSATAASQNAERPPRVHELHPHTGTVRIAPPRPAVASADSLRVLFIGNSYTYFHNLPDVLTALAAASTPSRQVHAEMIVMGGATLQQHWNGGEALARIEEGHWDAVVLQEQSMLGLHLEDGRPAINPPQFFHRYARLFARAIRRQGARMILYNTWSRRQAPAHHQAALDAAYITLGRELAAVVAPVGAAWQRVRAERPTLELYEDDGSHPSAAGTYLAAAVLWGAISGTSPAGLPVRVRGRPVTDLATGSTVADTLVTLVDLSLETATFLQAQAAGVLRQAQSAGGYLPVPAVPASSPPLVAGDAMSAASLVGTWRGTMRLYDAPAEVTLHITRVGGQLSGTWTERYADGGGTLSLPLSALRVEPRLVHFAIADPRFLAPPILHRAARRGNQLAGVAEVGGAEQLPHLVGHWTLRRR